MLPGGLNVRRRGEEVTDISNIQHLKNSEFCCNDSLDQKSSRIFCIESEKDCTLPETNIAPENRPSPQKERIIFQSIFRCCVGYRECKSTGIVPKNTPLKTNMEPENYSFEKKYPLPNLHFWVPAVCSSGAFTQPLPNIGHA